MIQVSFCQSENHCKSDSPFMTFPGLHICGPENIAEIMKLLAVHWQEKKIHIWPPLNYSLCLRDLIPQISLSDTKASLFT